MPFATPTYRTLLTDSRDTEDGTITLSVTGVVAGRALIVAIPTCQNTGASVVITGVTDTSAGGPNTWSYDNVRAGSDWVPNAAIAYCLNCKSGSYDINVSVDKSSGVKVNPVVVEVANIPTSAALEVLKKGTGSGLDYTLTEATGALTQQPIFALLCSAGWYGYPYTQSADGWDTLSRVQNGSGPGYIGSIVEAKTITSQSSFQGRVDHTGTPTSNSSVAMVLLKTSSVGSLRIKILADSASLVDGDGPWQVRLWRNGQPEQVVAQYLTISAPLPAAGTMYIQGADIPSSYSGLALTDTIYANIIGTTKHTGIIQAVVESY